MSTKGSVGRSIWRLAVGIWLGGLVFFSLVVTQVVFRVLPTAYRGPFLSALFPSYYSFEMWVGGAALLGIIWALIRGKMPRGWLVMVLTLAAWILVLWAQHILGLMNQVSAASTAFQRWHHESVIADGLVGVFLIISMLVDSWR